MCSWFEYFSGSAAIFFAYFFLGFALFRQRRLISIEGDRRLEGSSAQHANVYLRSRRIHVWDMWRTYIGMGYVEDIYRVCLRSIRMECAACQCVSTQ